MSSVTNRLFPEDPNNKRPRVQKGSDQKPVENNNPEATKQPTLPQGSTKISRIKLQGMNLQPQNSLEEATEANVGPSDPYCVVPPKVQGDTHFVVDHGNMITADDVVNPNPTEAQISDDKINPTEPYSVDPPVNPPKPYDNHLKSDDMVTNLKEIVSDPVVADIEPDKDVDKYPDNATWNNSEIDISDFINYMTKDIPLTKSALNYIYTKFVQKIIDGELGNFNIALITEITDDMLRNGLGSTNLITSAIQVLLQKDQNEGSFTLADAKAILNEIIANMPELYNAIEDPTEMHMNEDIVPNPNPDPDPDPNPNVVNKDEYSSSSAKGLEERQK